jgi:endothelin-converting enzyme/putative endopeptidase
LLVHRTFILAAVVAAGCQPRVRVPAVAESSYSYPALDASAIDRTAAPCQDFYQYACGRWIAETAVPADRAIWSRGAGEAEERNARLVRAVLDDALVGKVDPQDRAGRKAGDFYAACMDDVDVEARGRAELLAEWARLDAASDRAELAGELARLAAMGVAVPWELRAGVDPEDPRRGVLAPEAAGFGLPRRELYLSDGAEAVEAREQYLDHLRRELALAGAPAAEVEGLAQDVLALERALAEARAPAADRAAGFDRAGLAALAPGFPWDQLLHAVGAGARTRVSLAEPAFAAGLARLWLEAPLDRWRAYLRWRLAEAMADERALPAAMVEERFRFQGKLALGPAEPRPRWRHCVDETARAFDLGLGTALGRRQLGAGGRERAARITAAVEGGLARAIEGAPWADRETRARAAEKLERVEALVGFPDAAGPGPEKLRVGRGTYFRNVLSARRLAVAREVARAERPVDRAEWVESPLAAAPSYAPERNSLTVPAGALQPPLWIRDAPDAVAFGSLGARIGRALADAVEAGGRRRGPDGEATDWWTADAAQRFEARAACVADQFDAFQAEAGAPADGGRERGVNLAGNLADLAGLRAAYEAMRAARGEGPGGPRLLGFTPDQQFFLAYAQSQCTVSVGVEPGVTARFRVNGPLSNLPEFAKAFRCEPGSWMARPPAARCDVW